MTAGADRRSPRPGLRSVTGRGRGPDTSRGPGGAGFREGWAPLRRTAAVVIRTGWPGAVLVVVVTVIATRGWWG